jgi:hypothetical protein
MIRIINMSIIPPLSDVNHHVFQKGGAIVIARAVPVSSQIPSLLDPFTRKIYSPGSRLV